MGRHAGIVRRVAAATPSEGDAPIFAFGAELCDTSAFAPERAIPTGAGGAWTREEALLRCLGESAEHYAAAIYDPADLPLGEPPRGAVLPREAAPFSEGQRSRGDFPFARSGPVRWVRGVDWESARERCAPAFAVYIPYTPCAGEELYGPSLTTGLAAGPTIEAAREAALLEVVERHAFLRWWLSGEAAPRVECEAGAAVDLTDSLGIPVASVLIERDVLSVGSAAGRTFEAALAKARLEAELGQLYVRALVRRSPPPQRIVSFEDHARYYTDHAEHRGALDLYRSGPRRSPDGAEVDPLAWVLRAGLKPWWKDLTTPDLGSAGVFVARVLVPGLAQLHAIEEWPFLGTPGLLVRNRFPHPLP